MTGDRVFESFFNWIGKKSASKYYPFYLTATLIGISLLLAFPRYDLYHNNTAAWEVTMLKARDLTNSLSHISPDSFLAKKVFRLTVPVIIKIFHLSRPGVLVFQFVIGFLLLLFSFKLALRVLKDPVSATFVVGGITFLYCGRTCFTEITYTWFDGWAYFFLLLTIYFRNPGAVFLFASLAAWTDERALLALPLTILFHQVQNPGPTGLGRKGLLSPNSGSIAVLAALGGYFAVRTLLGRIYHMHTPNAGADLDNLRTNIIHASFGFGTFTYLEGFWLLAALLFIVAWKNKHYLFFLLTLSLILLVTVTTLMVMDLTRSGSYLFPVIFVFLLYLSSYIEQKNIRLITLTCLFFCLIFPPVNYIAFNDFLFYMEKPFFWVLASLLFGHP